MEEEKEERKHTRQVFKDIVGRAATHTPLQESWSNFWGHTEHILPSHENNFLSLMMKIRQAQPERLT